MQCEVCGNEYDSSFTVTLGGEAWAFDCFECAIHALAPSCAHCGCRVIGHGVSRDGEIFCGDHCVRANLAVQERAAAEREVAFEDTAFEVGRLEMDEEELDDEEGDGHAGADAAQSSDEGLHRRHRHY